MADPDARRQRQELEALQGRAKLARQRLEEAQTEGFVEELAALEEHAQQTEVQASQLEANSRATAQRLEGVQHDVSEAERQLLAPKTVSRAGIVAPVASVALLCGFSTLAAELSRVPWPPPSWVGVATLALVALPMPLLAGLWRRRLSGGGTFRTPSGGPG